MSEIDLINDEVRDVFKSFLDLNIPFKVKNNGNIYYFIFNNSKNSNEFLVITGVYSRGFFNLNFDLFYINDLEEFFRSGLSTKVLELYIKKK